MALLGIWFKEGRTVNLRVSCFSQALHESDAIQRDLPRPVTILGTPFEGRSMTETSGLFALKTVCDSLTRP